MRSYNPATGDVVWEGTAAGASDVKTAVEKARKAFPEWARLTIFERIAYLKSFEKILEQSKELIAHTIALETGKPLWDARNEVQAMINKIDISINAYEVRCPTTRNTRHKPHGVVAVYGPFNFPGHLPNGHIIPALLAGNTVIFKPSEHTPLTAERMMDCWRQVNLPEGVIQVLQGGLETGKLLSQAPIDGLLFTGSSKAGLSLRREFADHPEKILALEMGGNNPLIASNVKDHEAACWLIILSAYLTSGQRCTCARRLIVIEPLLETLTQMISKITVGAFNTNPEPFMGPLINVDAAQKVKQQYYHLIKLGATPLIPLKIERAFVYPTLVDVTGITPPDEEIFGPVLQVTRVANLDEAIEVANQTEYGLVAGLLSDSEEDYREFYHRIRAGVINWNTQTTGASSQAPFGGIGKSGNFRPSAFYAADYCSYPVASMESPVLKKPPLPPGL